MRDVKILTIPAVIIVGFPVGGKGVVGVGVLLLIIIVGVGVNVV